MEIILTKKISCINHDCFECSNVIREKLEKEFNCKLLFTKLADNSYTETHGSVTILHSDGNHEIRLRFWDKNENPNQNHRDPHKKLLQIPTESEIKKII